MDSQAQWQQAQWQPASWGNQASLAQVAQQLQKTQVSPSQVQGQMNASQSEFKSTPQSTIVPSQFPITNRYGEFNPGVEVFSNGVSLDSNLGVPKGTPVSLPPGKWQIMSTYSGAGDGQIGDSSNDGWGNHIVARNLENGDSIQLAHLSDVGVQQGQVIQGGMIVAKSGRSGNSTGPTLGMTYRDKNGNLGDIFNSPYARFIMPQSQ